MKSDCIKTTYSLNHAGYGMASIFGSTSKVKHNRLAYCQAHGLPLSAIEGKAVLHTCDNPACVNPAHLVLGTQLENIADRQVKGRQARGVTHASARLTDVDVKAIRASKLPIRTLASNYNVTPQSIGAIINRVTWKHIV